MKVFAAAACSLLCASTVALAQAPDPILGHYRAYRAALEAGDNVTAEREAAAAYDASAARDGDGGRTGVLALNLAKVRLANNHVDEAYAPAERASTIAAANANAGVDPLQAQLLVGQAELSDARESSGRTLLATALQQAVSNPDLAGDAYDAAVALGGWTFSHAEWNEAIAAWNYAAQYADGSDGDHAFARGQALTWAGAAEATFAGDLENHARELRVPSESRIFPDRNMMYQRAARALDEAADTLAHFVPMPATGADITAGQHAYALAVAWREALEARMRTTDQRAPDNNKRAGMNYFGDPNRNYCHVRLVAQPLPTFPSRAILNARIGAVVVRILTRPDGQISDIRIAAAVPAQLFPQAVETVLPRWRLERSGDSPRDCQVAPLMFQTVIFVFQ